jgi:hypothetical protein
MCDSIANGGPRAVAEKCCPPANVIIASNVLSTDGNVIAGNIIAVDGTFTGNLYVSGNIVSNIVYSSINVSGPINGISIWGTTFFGDGNGLSNLNASNLTGTISNTNLPPSGVTAGTYGSSANVSQVTVDQYGLVTAASNIGILSSQWTTVAGNVAYQNGVSIGTLSAPPVGSNLYVLGSANITDVLNVSTLYVNSATVFGSATLNVFGISNLNSVLASLYIGNGSGLSNLNSSNLVGNVEAANVASSVTAPAQPNITSVGILTGLNVSGISNLNSIVTSLFIGNGSAISNLNSSNLVGNVEAANVASSVTAPAQPNITSVGTLTGLTINGLIVASNGSAISNLNSSNLVGNVAAANVASSVTSPSQPNITSVGTLTGLTIQGPLIASNGSGISNINGSNVVGTVGTAQSVTNPAQPNITSVGTLSSLSVVGSIIGGTISGAGQGLFGIHGNAIIDTVMTANSVVQPSQPNITSVGTLTGLTVNGLLIASNGSAISNINGSNVSTVGTAKSVTVAAQLNITSVGTLTSLNVSGISNINSIVTNFISGNASGLSNVTAANLTGTISVGILPTSGVTAGLYGSGANVSSVTVDQYGRVTNASNVAITASQWTSNTGNSIYYANFVGIGSTFVPTANLHVIGNAYVSNSVTTTNIFFTNTIQDTNLPTTSVTPGGYGSVANIPQIVVDQYGRLTSASNIAFLATSQWTSIDANVAFGNGVSIGTLTNPPVGSNLYVLGTANIDSINTSSLSISNINLASANIATLVVPTQFNVVSANVLTGNISTANIANLRVTTMANMVSSNITNANIVSLNVSSAANITNLRVTTMANLVAANLTTANITTGNIVTANIVSLNVSSAANITNLRVTTMANLVAANLTTANITTDNVVLANIITANIGSLTVPGAFSANSTNFTLLYDTIIIPYLNVSITGNISNLFVTTQNVVTLNAFSILGTNSNIITANVTTANILTLNTSCIFATNSNIITANVVTLNVFSILGTNSNVTTENVVTLNAFSILGTNSNIITANVTTANILTLNTSCIFATNSIITTENVVTLNASSIFGINSNLSVINTFSISVTNEANVVSLNTGFLTVTSNILPGTGDGNTYIDGNIIVSGNVFSSLGMPLGSGGGYYFSLPTDIVLQVPYTGALYGTTYPLSVGLSNGFTINGTSTLITVTANGNFSFNTAGPYLLRGVFNSSDNITGLAVGSNVADVHGTDQGYMYRYTTFITQNPTELIEIPFNVTDVSLYYYLDLFSTDGGIIHATATTSGGTYMTITPLQGGGLATGGPGGTPGTQWISSGSNIYYSNSVGIGAINPQYKLDVSGDLRVTGNIYGNVIGTTLFSVVTGLTSNYTALISDYYIGVNGARKVTLPLGSSISVGKSYIVKDEAGNAAATSVLLQASGSDVIDGNSNVTMSLNNISLTTLWTGTRWSLI